MFNNYIKKISTSIICLLIVFSLCGCIDISDIDNGKDIKDKDVLIVGFFENLSLYPFRLNVYNQQTIKPNLFNGLVEFDEKFQIIPALSESWNNPDNLTWRFNLRRNISPVFSTYQTLACTLSRNSCCRCALLLCKKTCCILAWRCSG